jgi:hypothetical protein
MQALASDSEIEAGNIAHTQTYGTVTVKYHSRAGGSCEVIVLAPSIIFHLPGYAWNKAWYRRQSLEYGARECVMFIGTQFSTL